MAGNRQSQQEVDGVVWQTAGLRLGELGLDLRQPSDPTALADLLNARFIDEKNVRRRDGYRGVTIRDNGGYPLFYDATNTPIGSPIGLGGWLYGHGQRLAPGNALARGDEHIPTAGQARATFTYEGSDVVWTGDRLLVSRDEGNALGSSTFWSTTSTPLAYGVPAYLPLETHVTPPEMVTGSDIQTCLTATTRVTVADSNGLVAWVTDRVTGALINKSTIGGGTAPADVRLFVSGPYVVCVWRDTLTHNAYINAWQGTAWGAASVIASSVYALDVAPVDGGFHLLYRSGTSLKLGRYVGNTNVNTPYAFNTVVTTGGTPNGAVALAVAENGAMCAVWSTTTDLRAHILSPFGVAAGSDRIIAAGSGPWDGGVTVHSRLLTRGVLNRWVVYAGEDGTGIRTTHVVEFDALTGPVVRENTRYNTVLASRAFRVGNEVFCWLRGTNASTNYLLGGVGGNGDAQVCGYAEREESAVRQISGGVLPDGEHGTQALAMVNPDPLDPMKVTWARPFNTGQTYAHQGNCRMGDLNFLPPLSTAKYGRCVYLSGSAVRCWDGFQLGDAGFQDYPKVAGGSQGGGGTGSLSAGTYYWRAYAVRYNARGERFQSAGITFGPITAANNDSFAMQIYTLPSTNHDDVQIEIYRTQAGGQVFFLEATVPNDRANTYVNFTSTLSDATLKTRVEDPHANLTPGVTTEVEEWGPIGCAFLVTVGDRLWGAGGQLSPGTVQFSKLKEDGEGVGFDDLGGFLEIDTTGGEVTSIAGTDAVVFFQPSRIHVLGGFGPDNLGQGGYSAPQIVRADGAVTHQGTVLTPAGIVFWGAEGPRILTSQYSVENISLPVRARTKGMTPTGVQLDVVRQEVVWFSADGTAVLWNYLGGSRWAEWSGLPIAGCSETALATSDGRLLFLDEAAIGDDGVPFEFRLATGDIRPDRLLEGATEVRKVGIVGQHLGPHTLRFRVYYNGGALWTDEFIWEPETGTYLTSVANVATLTPAQVDALSWVDKSGGYSTSHRARRQTCHHFRVEISDMSSWTQTYLPFELSFELGAKPGLGRTPVNTFKA
jgi:hypothetical protein